MSCLGQKATTPLDLDGHKVINVATPTDAGDAVNKSYVDGQLGIGLVYAESTTAPDGNTRTFAFTKPVTNAYAVYIGGIAQRPIDFSVVGGAIVFENNVPAPDPGLQQFVTALYS